MKVSLKWLQELVDLPLRLPPSPGEIRSTDVEIDELVKLLIKRTVGVKEVSPDFIELDMKGYNRSDLLSLRGVALEVGSITDSPVKFTELGEDDYIWKNLNLPTTPVEVEDTNHCPVYCIAKIEGLRVEPSSPEWTGKLAACGMRSVNNVADITNLIMLEYGQPMHAFDASQVKDQTLIVRSAKSGEELVTLDEKTRQLLPPDILITDSEKILGLAGVMGGKNSEVTDNTQTILLEAAIFDPITLRRTVQKLGLPSEASKRFQHGLIKKRLLQSLDAAIKMYQQLGGKLTALTLIGDFEEKETVINLTRQKTNSLIGIDLPKGEIKSYLEQLHFKLEEMEGESWKVTVPYFRLDVGIEEDLIEEVARMYGYEKIPAKPLIGNLPAPIDQKLFDFIYQLKTTLVETGLTEIQTYSFYPTLVLNSLNPDRAKLMRVTNPMSRETEYLRDKLWPNLIEKVALNLKNTPTVAVFEIGKVYLPQAVAVPKEPHQLAVALSTGSTEVFNELYQLVQQAVKKLNLALEFDSSEENQDFFHPHKFVKILFNGERIGEMAEVHPRILDHFGINQRVAILEINLDTLVV